MTAAEAEDMAWGLCDWLERGGFPPFGLTRTAALDATYRYACRASRAADVDARVMVRR